MTSGSKERTSCRGLKERMPRNFWWRPRRRLLALAALVHQRYVEGKEVEVREGEGRRGEKGERGEGREERGERREGREEKGRMYPEMGRRESG
jgi:hypothetical protein